MRRETEMIFTGASILRILSIAFPFLRKLPIPSERRVSLVLAESIQHP